MCIDKLKVHMAFARYDLYNLLANDLHFLCSLTIANLLMLIIMIIRYYFILDQLFEYNNFYNLFEYLDTKWDNVKAFTVDC